MMIAKTEHDAATGQFTSSSGKSYSMKDASTKHATKHDVHDASGQKIGTVHSGSQGSHSEHHYAEHEGDKHIVQGPLSSSREWGQINVDAHDDARAETAKKLADYHESKTKKATSIGDLVKSMDIISPTMMSMLPFVGSYEDSLRAIRGPVCMGSGCDHKPEYDDSGNRIYPVAVSDEPRVPAHYLDVVATFPDHAYVRCSDEDKVWKVPYTFEDDAVSTGEPELYVAQFVPADEAEGESSDDDAEDSEAA